MIFSTSQVKKAIFKCKIQLGRLAGLLTLDHNQETQSQFEEAVENYDLDTINKLIENAFNTQLNADNINKDLALFNSQFSELNISLEGKTIQQKIVELSNHSAEIRSLIKSRE